MKQSYKKTLAVLAMASMVVLSSCSAVPTNEDPAAILKDARANFVSEVTSSIDKDPSGSSMINFDGTASAGGVNVTFDGSTDAKSALENDTPSSSILFKLNAALEGATMGIGKTTGAVEMEIRTIAKVLYGQIMKAEAQSETPELDAQIKQVLPLVAMYSGKWFKIDQAALEQMSGAGSAVQAINKEEVKALVAELNNHEIFTLEEKLQPAGDNFAYKVRLNADGIASLINAVNAKTNPGTPMTEADMQEVKDAITAINNEKGITHTLYIDAASKKYKKFESKGTIEREGMKTTVNSVIESPKTEAAKWTLAVDAVDAAANITNSFKLDLSQMDGKITGKVTLSLSGTSPVTADININGTYNKVTIEVPADATDLTQMLGGMAAPATATGTTLDMSSTTDEAALNQAVDQAMLENAMGE